MESDVLLNGLLMNPSNAMAETDSRKCVEQVPLPVWLSQCTAHAQLNLVSCCTECKNIDLTTTFSEMHPEKRTIL